MDTTQQAAQEIQAVLQKYGKKFEVVHSVVINDVNPQAGVISESSETPAPETPDAEPIADTAQESPAPEVSEAPAEEVQAQEPQPEITQ